jgi:hypothetical protein
MAGGGGFEWYVQQDGGGHGFDQQIDDFGLMAEALEWSGHALDFLALLPLERMTASRMLATSSAGGNTYVLAAPDVAYALYNDRNGGPIEIDLSGSSPDTTFDVTWFDPRTGAMAAGSVARVDGGATVGIGTAPTDANTDWAVMLVAETDLLFANGFEP